jgi:hypothetical protein
MVFTGFPFGSVTPTEKSTPASAELVPTSSVAFFCRLTSVRRPMTAEGSMTNTLPAPLLVLIAALNVPAQLFCPGVIVHTTHCPVERSHESPVGQATVDEHAGVLLSVQVELCEQVAPPVIEPF